jgi:ABC-type branched-subunit amino acid transport system ATPase component
MQLLKIRNITKRFGGVLAVNDISIDVPSNALMGLVGPNGSGKTTLLNIIAGFEKPDSGSVYLDEQVITGLKPHQIASKGIYRTFQLTRVFEKMTVLENLLVVPCNAEREPAEKALRLLEFANLIRLKNEYAGSLSYGQQKLLEFLRPLMADPKMLLLDEPLAGVNPVVIEEIITFVRRLREDGKTLLIVEHNIPALCSMCDEIIVMDHGIKIASGTPKEIQCDERVIKAYLGTGG